MQALRVITPSSTYFVVISLKTTVAKSDPKIFPKKTPDSRLAYYEVDKSKAGLMISMPPGSTP